MVTKAVAEAPGKHAFITEYAADSGVMIGLLDPPGRFSGVPALASQTNAYRYVETVMAPGVDLSPARHLARGDLRLRRYSLTPALPRRPFCRSTFPSRSRWCSAGSRWSIISRTCPFI